MDIRPKYRQQTNQAARLGKKKIFYNGEFDPGSG